MPRTANHHGGLLIIGEGPIIRYNVLTINHVIIIIITLMQKISRIKGLIMLRIGLRGDTTQPRTWVSHYLIKPYYKTVLLPVILGL